MSELIDLFSNINNTLLNFSKHLKEKEDQNEMGLFNTHEIWGIFITSIYFSIGFPTNLLAITICLKSLMQKFCTSSSKNKNSTKRCERKYNKANNQTFRDEKNHILVKNKSKEKRHFVGIEEIKEYKKPITKFAKLNQLETSQNKVNQHNYNKSDLKFSHHRNSSKETNKAVVRFGNNFKNNMSIRKPNPHQLCFELYFIEISFCDMIILGYNFTEWTLLILSRFELIDSIYIEPILISKFMCRFIIALNRTVILLHNWLVAMLALTRCYAIYKPLNSTTSFSSKFYFRLNLCVLTALLLIFTSSNIYGVLLLSYYPKSVNSLALDHNINQSIGNQTNLMPFENRAECRISNEIYAKYKYIDAYINLTLGIIGYSLPCLITLFINLLLIRKLRYMRLLNASKLNERSGNHSNPNSSIDSKLYKHRKFDHIASRNRSQFLKTTSSLLTLSFAYLICYIPYSVMFLLLSLDIITMNGDVIFSLTCLRYLNHTLNFYIYFLTGKKFRNDLFNFLRFKKNN
jgi:hypothetical protein